MNATEVSTAPALAPLPNPVRRLLVAVDAFAPDQETVRHAMALAPKLEATIVLLHVVMLPVEAASQVEAIPGFLLSADALRADHDKARERAVASLTELERTLQLDYLKVESHVLLGSAYVRILDAVKEFDCDMLLIATHGYTGLKRLILGSTAEQVVRHAHCPVIVVRRKDAERVES